MAIKDIDTKCWILALFVRDDGQRFLLGDGSYEFEEKQLHFVANAMANDVVEVQGNDGYLLAGQVRRPSTQSFDGYVGDSSTSKAMVEERRRAFFAFFRKNHFYKVIYVFPDGSAIQRKRGFLVDAPEVKEMWQIYPKYHVALNFEDINYYYYNENADGEEIYGKSATISLNSAAQTGGLIWVEPGRVEISEEGTNFTVPGTLAGGTLESLQLKGDTTQQTYSGKNLFNINDNSKSQRSSKSIDGNKLTVTCTTAGTAYTVIELPNSDALLGKTCRLKVGNISVTSGSGTTQGMIRVMASLKTNLTSLAGDEYGQVRGLGDNLEGAVAFPNSYPDSKDCFVLVVYVGNRGGSTVVGEHGDYEEVQLELGSTATSYEPYTGGTASPNPDYPQAVQVVTGEQTVTITDGQGQSQEYTVELGRNLFDKSLLPTTWNNTSTQWITLQLEPNTNYTMSSSIPFSSGGYANIFFTDSTKTGGTATNGVKEGKNVSITTLADGIAAIGYRSDGGSTITRDNYWFKVQETATIELCKIGDYQDYIYKSGDDWYLHKATYHLSLAISSMNNSENYPGWTGVAALADTLGTGRNGGVGQYTTLYCNICGPGDTTTDWSIYVNTNSSNRTLFLNRSFFGTDHTMTYWKTNYSSLIVELYYGITTTPTDTQITNAALVEQLDALAGATTYSGQTVFTVDGNGNLATILSIELEITGGGGVLWDENGAVWEEGEPSYSMVAIDSIDNVYPVLTIAGRTVDPILTDVTTGMAFQYNGTITESQVLRIDMLNKTATLNGTSVVGNVTGDWLYLAPGNNKITYTADNADAPNATLEWQEIVG